MATRTWTGSAGDGSFTTVANWGGTVPVTGDTAIISASATTGITSGLDRSADGVGAGLNLVLLKIEDGFKYDIGSASGSLLLTADSIVDRGQGNTWITSKTGSAALDTDLVTVDKQKGGLFTFDHNGSSNVSQLRITGGLVYFTGTAVALPLVYITPRPGNENNCRFTSQGSVVVTLGYMAGGSWTCKAGATTVYLGGGTFTAGTTSAIAITTFYHMGGTFMYNHNSAAVTTTTHYGFNGTLNGTSSGATKTITTLTRSQAFNFVSGPNLTVTTDTVIGD